MSDEKIDPGEILEIVRRAREGAVPLDTILDRVLDRRPRRSRSRGTRKFVLAALRRMIADGKIDKVIGGYRIARRDGLIEGVVETVDAGDEAVVIDPNDVAWSVHSPAKVAPGARVLVSPIDAANHRGSLVGTIDPPNDEWVGVLQSERRHAWVVPFQSRLRFRIGIDRKDLGSARDGDLVVVRTQPAAKHRRRKAEGLRGTIVEHLGRPGDPEADFRAVVWNHRLRTDFSEAVTAEAEALEERLDPAEIHERLDLRDAPFLTIDPATARDHDDAIWVDERGGQVQLWVAIADVAHYVEIESELDHEAMLRGNSVYFPDRAIPMLPDRISGNLCSLRADRDRFAVAVEMTIGRDGQVTRERFHTVVIRVRANLAYEDAAARMAQGPESTSAKAGEREINEQLQRLANLEACLSRRRFERGSIEFALPESQIVLDKDGRPEAIVQSVRTRAHRAVEEAMLAANRAVARHLIAREAPAIYRIHEPPDDRSLATLREQLVRFDLLDPGAKAQLDGLQIHRALARAAGRPVAPIVNLMALRTMTQARYGEENRGHFALGFDAYLHFTSPIRRYADLAVHRALKHTLRPDRDRLDARLARAERRASIARFISVRERAAVDAERSITDLKKCVFMLDKVGDVDTGRVTGVARHGLYVTLDSHDVTGLVPSASLGFGLDFDEAAHALVARRSGARFALGDAMRVKVEEVNLVRGWIRLAPRSRHGSSDDDEDGPKDERGPKKRGRNPRGKGKPVRRKKGAVKKGRRPGRKARRKGAPNPGKGRRP